MAFDAFYMSAVLEEIRALGDARVDKLHQPGRDTVILHLKGREARAKLLINPNPAAPRLHLTEANPENPAQPPMFCMLLRKHLLGARLIGVEQPVMERAAIFRFQCTDELGDRVEKRLVAELMGRTCNLYLLGPDGRIIDCLRRIGLDETSHRPALPGLIYQEPEAITKLDPRSITEEDYVNLLSRPGADILCQRLMDELGGLSPLVCREAALYAAGDTQARVGDAPAEATAEKLYLFFQEHLNHGKPYYYTAPDGTPKQFAFCPIRQYGDCHTEESFSLLLDRFYTLKDQKEAMRQKGQAVRKTVTNLCRRLTRKMAIQRDELEDTFGRERLREFGDLIMANLHLIKKGQTELTVPNLFNEHMMPVTISLSPLLTPQQNAARYYKDYNRMKNAERELRVQLERAEEELYYLESVLAELDRAATEQELEEIRQELSEGGYLKQDSGKKRMKQGKLPPMRFESTDGYPIYVGRNNRQNDELTFKVARKDDLWLHATGVHGSHVIISCGGTTPPDDTVTQAAQLAAFYSDHRGGQNLPVDVTPVKQVKKAPSSRPGLVIYHTHRTVIVNPYPDIVVDELNAEKKACDSD